MSGGSLASLQYILLFCIGGKGGKTGVVSKGNFDSPPRHFLARGGAVYACFDRRKNSDFAQAKTMLKKELLTLLTKISLNREYICQAATAQSALLRSSKNSLEAFLLLQIARHVA